MWDCWFWDRETSLEQRRAFKRKDCWDTLDMPNMVKTSLDVKRLINMRGSVRYCSKLMVPDGATAYTHLIKCLKTAFAEMVIIIICSSYGTVLSICVSSLLATFHTTLIFVINVTLGQHLKHNLCSEQKTGPCMVLICFHTPTHTYEGNS